MGVAELYRDRANLGHVPVLKGQTLIETPYRLQADANTLDLWWLNEGRLADVKDYGSAAKHGTISGATWNTTGPWGSGLTFDAVLEKVQVDGAAQVGTGNFTIEIVASHATAAAAGWSYEFFGSSNSSGGSVGVIGVGIRGTSDAVNVGKFCIAISPAGTWLELYSSARYDDNVIRYYTVVVDRSTPLTTLYVNGASVASSAINYGANSLSNTYARLGGRGIEASGNQMYGGLYLIRISNIARPAGEILTNAKLMGFA